MNRSTLTSSPVDRFRAEVVAGLSRSQKQLPPKYFYDAAGSRLFDLITGLPEYYPTRTELGILRENAGAMADRCGRDCLLVEYGAGSLTKVRFLLDRLEHPAGYVPVDVSGDHLRWAAAALADDYPSLHVEPVVADFTEPFDLPRTAASRRVVFFPGSTLGNFDPREADGLLRRMARLVGPGGGLLLGVDLQKDVDVLERAYNDEAGVTAAFNRNVLVRINRELGADFELDTFRHVAFYNRTRERIEMHLVSAIEQRVQIGTSAIRFQAGESIHTENSYKYNIPDLAIRAARCGFRLDTRWSDPSDYFAMLYFKAEQTDS